MRSLAALIVLVVGIAWLTAIGGTLAWMRAEVASTADTPAGAERTGPTSPTPPKAEAERPRSPADILHDHFGWALALGITLGLITYLPIALLAWLVLVGKTEPDDTKAIRRNEPR